MWCLTAIVFLAAFLLFQIELIFSKLLLFKFGGSFSVWAAAIAFFQAALLLGYFYSHFIIKKIGIFRYRRLHLALFFLTFFLFPRHPLSTVSAQYQIPMVLNIFRELLRSIGPAFFILSTVSIIFQIWLADSRLPQRVNPYALYAVSNMGSFLGLLTYPFLFEKFFGLNTQLIIWRGAYLILFLLQLIAFKLVGVTKKKIEKHNLSPVTLKQKLYWFLLSAGGVMLYLSATNIITYEITPTPLLWILPLCVYLISFVLNFKAKPYCPPNIKQLFFFSISLNILLYYLIYMQLMHNLIIIIAFLFLLFIACMYCQNELSSAKPEGESDLTRFYLIISAGGFAGGIFVSWIVPLISRSMTEYFLSLFLILITAAIKENKQNLESRKIRTLIYCLLFIAFTPFALKQFGIFTVVLFLGVLKCIHVVFADSLANIVNLSLIILFSCSIFNNAVQDPIHYKYRNYYGIYTVLGNGYISYLLNGNTMHGAQFTHNDQELEPLTYYHRRTAPGQVLLSDLFQIRNIGIIGLGCGTLAAYEKPAQTIDFFELDPDVYKIANKHFTYLKKAAGRINYIFGDARISLKNIADKHYDLMIVDAFSGDSVPFHLLTVEAIKEYLRCTSDTGLILFHISSRYVDFVPVLFSNAKELNLHVCLNDGIPLERGGGKHASLWLAVTPSLDTCKKAMSGFKWKGISPKPVKPWTDEYTDVLSIIKLNEFLPSFKR